MVSENSPALFIRKYAETRSSEYIFLVRQTEIEQRAKLAELRQD